jgi:prepilin-type N-terminal cleavage/methylation domain-containing protein
MRGHFYKGFTIVELMVVVAIIGVMFLSIAPAVTSAMADGRAADAAVDVVRLARAARAETNVSGLAHVIVFDNNTTAGVGGGQDVGRMRLYRGEVDAPSPAPDGVSDELATCNPDRWDFANMAPIDEVNLASYNIRNSAHWITLEQVNADDSVVAQDKIIHQICFQPDGRMLLRHATTAPFVSTAPFGESFDNVSDPIFAVFRKLNGAQAGVPRQIIFTFGGNARIRR